MKAIFFLLLNLICNASIGQITNSSSPDKTGMIFYAVDSVVQIVKTMKAVDRIILRTNSSYISNFPDDIQGVTIIKQQGIEDFSVKGMAENDIVFRIMGLSINRDQVTLSIGTYQKGKKRLSLFGDVIYIFHYQYFPDSQTYKIIKLKKGMVL